MDWHFPQLASQLALLTLNALSFGHARSTPQQASPILQHGHQK